MLMTGVRLTDYVEKVDMPMTSELTKFETPWVFCLPKNKL